MRIRLSAAEEQRAYDTQLGRFTDAEAIPCFRCGVCCQRWQPLVDHTEAERLATHLGVETELFLAEYARPYPLREDTYQLNARDGGCVFLAFAEGRAACTVHEARPQACRAWDASFARKECLDGLRALGDGVGLVSSLGLFSGADAATFVAHLRTLRPLDELR